MEGDSSVEKIFDGILGGKIAGEGTGKETIVMTRIVIGIIILMFLKITMMKGKRNMNNVNMIVLETDLWIEIEFIEILTICTGIMKKQNRVEIEIEAETVIKTDAQ